MHPQEIRLVRRGEASGKAIPTRDYEPMRVEAVRLGPDHCAAFNEQVKRQEAEL